MDWSKYCLAHLFTYQDFADGVIGLAYVGNPKRNAVGGICTESNYKLLFIVGNGDRDIGRYSGRQSVDTRSTLGRYSVDIAVDSRSIVRR